jgi:hypothetical protein
MSTASLVEEFCQKLAPYFEEQRKHIFNVQMLDHGNEVLASGTALLDEDTSHGAFWPQSEWPVGKQGDVASLLKRSDSRIFAVREFHLCPAVGRQHFHFRFAPKS